MRRNSNPRDGPGTHLISGYFGILGFPWLAIRVMAAAMATGANAQNLHPIRRGTSKNTALADPPRSMEDIAEGARKVLNHIENNGLTSSSTRLIFPRPAPKKTATKTDFPSLLVRSRPSTMRITLLSQVLRKWIRRAPNPEDWLF
ncbi:uncharacterized protein N7511_004273 [Penicillium nucicola]|uniref:uncharacterized protein n=1 Tax=Penicillium nucicola TaxID=1850975 RepID=UPI002544DD0A|nr:uncharacterized protein N7511_004273 [Penicillium nucicola]KAJ5766657.1 hypothetical protein N7511_004273 [Penicillium nucicola]